MATAQDAITTLQTHTIDAIKSGQDAAAEAVQAWSHAVTRVTPGGAWPLRDLPSGVESTVGDPAAIVDSVYDFATSLLTLNKQFVHRLFEVSEPAASKPAKATVK
jgi:hypothetical protein